MSVKKEPPKILYAVLLILNFSWIFPYTRTLYSSEMLSGLFFFGAIASSAPHPMSIPVPSIPVAPPVLEHIVLTRVCSSFSSATVLVSKLVIFSPAFLIMGANRSDEKLSD